MPSVYLGAPGANYNYQSGTTNNSNNKGNGYNGNYVDKGNNSAYLTPGVNQTPNMKSSYGGATPGGTGTGFGHGGYGNSSYGQNQFGGGGKGNSAYYTPTMTNPTGGSGYVADKYSGGGQQLFKGQGNQSQFKGTGAGGESPGGAGGKAGSAYLTPAMAKTNGTSGYINQKYTGGGSESSGVGSAKSPNVPLSPATTTNNDASSNTNNKQGGGAQYPSNVQVGQYPFVEQGNENPAAGNGGQSQLKKKVVGGVKDASGYMSPTMVNAKDKSGYATNQTFTPRINQTEEQGTKKQFKDNGVGNEPTGVDGAKGEKVNLNKENQNGASGNITIKNPDDDKNVSRRTGGRNQLKRNAGNPGAEDPESPGGDKTKATNSDPTQANGNGRSKLDKATSTRNENKTNPTELVNRNEYVSESVSKATDIRSNNKGIIEDVKSAQIAASMVTAITNSRTSSTTQDSSTLVNTAVHDVQSIETKTGIMIGRTKKQGQKSQDDVEDDDNKYVLLPGDGEDMAKHKANAGNNNGDSINKKKKKKKKKKDNKVEVHIVYEEVEI